MYPMARMHPALTISQSPGTLFHLCAFACVLALTQVPLQCHLTPEKPHSSQNTPGPPGSDSSSALSSQGPWSLAHLWPLTCQHCIVSRCVFDLSSLPPRPGGYGLCLDDHFSLHNPAHSLKGAGA